MRISPPIALMYPEREEVSIVPFSPTLMNYTPSYNILRIEYTEQIEALFSQMKKMDRLFTNLAKVAHRAAMTIMPCCKEEENLRTNLLSEIQTLKDSFPLQGEWVEVANNSMKKQ